MLLQSAFEAAGTYLAVDFIFLGLSVAGCVLDVLVGVAVGSLWHVLRSEPRLTVALGVCGYLLTMFLGGMPTSSVYLKVLAVAVVAIASRVVARQRLERRMGI